MNKFNVLLFCLSFCSIFSQKKEPSIKLIRSGFVYGYAAQNKYIQQDSDYRYESYVYMFSNHFHLYKKPKYALEITANASYYSSKHECYNIWHEYFTSSADIDAERAKFLPLKDMNEYALNFGILYRRNIFKNLSAYAMGSIGPMYIDTDTERLKKGFAFSDIFALGFNYKWHKFSIDVKTMIRHVSNANLKYPNFGYNALGFEIGSYIELE
jgi:hypothetical protein